MLVRWKKFARWTAYYLAIIVGITGLAAGEAYLYAIGLYAAPLRISFPFLLLINGLGTLAAGFVATPNVETGSMRIEETYEISHIYARARYFKRVQDMLYNRIFVSAGLTLIGIGFYLMVLWNV